MSVNKSAKTFTIEAAMKDPKMRRAFKDAMTAPPGSTKRQVAKAMLSSIYKISSKKIDGQGGGGIPRYSKKNPWARYKMPQPRNDGQGGMAPYNWEPYKQRLSSGESWGSVWNDAKAKTGADNAMIDQALNKDVWSKPGAFQATQAENSKPSGIVPKAASWLANRPGQVASDIKSSFETYVPTMKGLYQYGSGVNEAWGNIKEDTNRAAAEPLWYGKGNLPKRYDKYGREVPNLVYDPWKTGSGQEAVESFGEAGAKLKERYPWLFGAKNNLSSPAQAANAQAPEGVPTVTGAGPFMGAGLTVDSQNKQPSTSPSGYAYDPKSSQIPASWLPSATSGEGAAGMGSPGGAGYSESFDTSFSMDGDFSQGDPGTGYGASYSSEGLSGWDKLKSGINKGYSSGLGATASVEQVLNDPAMQAELKELFPDVPEWAIPKGASLANHLMELKEAKKAELGLDSLLDRQKQMIEQGSTLKDDLVEYVKNRDEYVTKIDSLINDSQEQFLNRADAADPRVRGMYDQYQQYLTTLKGRQNKRYTDVINDSINQHNKELEQLNTQYQNVLQQYNEEVADQATISQEVYTRMYNALTEMYNGFAGAAEAERDMLMWEADYNKKLVDTYKSSIDATDTSNKIKEGDYVKGFQTVDRLVDSKTGYLPYGLDLPAQLAALQDNNWDKNAQIGFIEGIMNKAISELSTAKDDDAIGNELSRIAKINQILSTYANTPEFAENYSNLQIIKMNSAISSKLGSVLELEQQMIENYLLQNSGELKAAIGNLYGKESWAPFFEDGRKRGLDENLLNIVWSMKESGELDDSSRGFKDMDEAALAREVANSAVMGMARNNFNSLL